MKIFTGFVIAAVAVAAGAQGFFSAVPFNFAPGITDPSVDKLVDVITDIAIRDGGYECSRSCLKTYVQESIKAIQTLPPEHRDYADQLRVGRPVYQRFKKCEERCPSGDLKTILEKIVGPTEYIENNFDDVIDALPCIQSVITAKGAETEKECNGTPDTWISLWKIFVTKEKPPVEVVSKLCEYGLCVPAKLQIHLRNKCGLKPVHHFYTIWMKNAEATLYYYQKKFGSAVPMACQKLVYQP